MRRVLGDRPVELAVVVPLVPHPEIAAHEQELLARQRPLVAVQQAQVGVLLPRIARQLGQHRALAVDDLVVRQRQDEVLGERVERAKRQLVVVPPAVDRIARDEPERVVHPAEVPLVAEPQAPGLGRPRHPAPRGRLLGDGLDVGVRGVDRAVALLQEADRVAVVVRAVLVGHPLAGLARVVAVQHRGHPVDPQAVDVVAVEPGDRRRDQERPHLVAAVVEDVAGPVGVEPAPRVGVLEQVGAVEQPRGRAASVGKCAGTQSTITPMPRWCRPSIIAIRSSGAP